MTKPNERDYRLAVALVAILRRKPMDEYEAGYLAAARDIAAATGYLELIDKAEEARRND
jgi:hypothetical protein